MKKLKLILTSAAIIIAIAAALSLRENKQDCMGKTIPQSPAKKSH
ncbi:MAG TPA: hypothetical protein VGM89_13920 [Puia sp.]